MNGKEMTVPANLATVETVELSLPSCASLLRRSMCDQSIDAVALLDCVESVPIQCMQSCWNAECRKAQLSLGDVPSQSVEESKLESNDLRSSDEKPAAGGSRSITGMGQAL